MGKCGDPSLGNFSANSCGCLVKELNTMLGQATGIVNQEVRVAQKLVDKMSFMKQRGLIDDKIHEITSEFRKIEDCVDLGLSTPRSTSASPSFGNAVSCVEGAVSDLLNGAVNGVLEDIIAPFHIDAITDYIDGWGEMLADFRLSSLLGTFNLQLGLGPGFCGAFDAESLGAAMTGVLGSLSADPIGRINASGLIGDLMSPGSLASLGESYVDDFTNMINFSGALKIKNDIMTSLFSNVADTSKFHPPNFGRGFIPNFASILPVGFSVPTLKVPGGEDLFPSAAKKSLTPILNFTS